MKYIRITFLITLTATTSPVFGTENCWAYKSKNDFSGFNACEARNDLEFKNSMDRNEQKAKEQHDRQKREVAENEEKQFRQNQLDLQRQQLELQKRNTITSRCDDPTKIKAQAINDVVIKVQEPTNKLLRKYISSGKCAEAKELAEVAVMLGYFEIMSKASATGNTISDDQAAQRLFSGGVLAEFAKKCK